MFSGIIERDQCHDVMKWLKRPKTNIYKMFAFCYGSSIGMYGFSHNY